MNKKSLIRYSHNNETGFMHYVIYNGDIVVLSVEKSKKIDFIKENGRLNVTFDVKQENFGFVNVSFSNDMDYVEKVYNYMLETNNAYFKDGFEGLCVIKFEKKTIKND